MPLSSHLAETGIHNEKGWLRGTAAKVFFIMMLALLPLALAAIIANWQSIRTAETEKIELMGTATRQNALHLASDIDAIRTMQSLTATVLATSADTGNICERLRRVFDAMAGAGGIETVIFDVRQDIHCQSRRGAALIRGAVTLPFSVNGLALARDGLLIRSTSRDGSLTAVSIYSRSALKLLTSGDEHDPRQAIALQQGNQQLVLAGRPSGQELEGKGAVVTRAPVGDNGLDLLLAIHGKGAGARTLSLLMPLLIWLAAAFLGWLVVRWTLIEPLIALRREVAAYVPGQVMHPPPTAKIASSEIGELGHAFHEMSEDVAEHEEEMRQALNRQMQLTREVHHRVKNNLQIISSLISLHWRAAGDTNAASCYLSIQRRVDALAVVQRNHYAELDEERGVRARPMMNEIAAALRTSAQIQEGNSLDVTVQCDDVYLHQDVAAPLAFMTAELADLVIALETGGQLSITLERLQENPERACFGVTSPAFNRATASANGKVELYERVLNGLARQLRTPLEHDVERGEYSINVPVTG